MCEIGVLKAKRMLTALMGVSLVVSAVAGDFVIENGVLKKWNGDGDSAVIPDGVKEIGESAFRDCKRLKSVSIPDSCRQLGMRSFEGCSSLKKIVIPEGVLSVPYGAFRNCTSLESVILPTSLRVIDFHAFRDCDNIQSVVMPSVVSTIHKKAFGGCEEVFAKAINLARCKEEKRMQELLQKAEEQRRREEEQQEQELERERLASGWHRKDGRMYSPEEWALEVEKERMSQGWHKDGDRWFTPEEWTEECYKTNAWRKIKPKTISRMKVHILRSTPQGAICVFEDSQSVLYEEFCGKIFFSSELKSSIVADDDAEWWRVCYWCGTCTIETKDGARTVNEYAKDLDVAIKIVRKKFSLFNKGDSRFKSEERDKLQPKGQGEERCSGTGSGFFVSENIVVTCAHVVKGGSRIACVVGSKTEKVCDVLACDDRHDVALLRVRGYSYRDYLAVERKSSKISDKVFTVGYPLSSMIGSEPKYSEGVVGAVNGIGGDVTCYQISVPVQPGNSGGPLLDAKTGGVVGVVSARLSDAAAVAATGTVPQGINYAVKVRYVLDLLDANSIKYVDTTAPDECDPDVEFAKGGTVLVRVYE